MRARMRAREMRAREVRAREVRAREVRAREEAGESSLPPRAGRGTSLTVAPCMCAVI